MKTQLWLLSIALIGLVACSDQHLPTEKKTAEIPKALTDNSSSGEVIYKRERYDLVESLYEELTTKTPALQALESQIENLQSSRNDSTGIFENFNGKNTGYYSSAKDHLAQISDSTLREKIRSALAASLQSYNGSISKHMDILKEIDTTNKALNDLHVAMKIILTLPLIEKYQKENLPSTKPMEGYLKEMNKALKSIDSLVNE